MQRPKLRDNIGRKPFELYPLGQIPDEAIFEIGRWITYFCAIGKSDISGEDWGDIFARSIKGEHLGRPLGLADVVYEGMAWSVKSIKHNNPHSAGKIRVISGRCSPDYSYNIANAHEDVQMTGNAVLSIWNERINIAKRAYEPLRTAILIRNFSTLEFTLFEYETTRFVVDDFKWEVNERGNFEGYHIATDSHCFTWQPHGSQFTVLIDVPAYACKFKLKRPRVLDFDKTLEQVGFETSWVSILLDYHE